MAKNIDAKLVLELFGRGMTGREIQRTCHIAQQIVKKAREAAEKRGVAWADVERMDGGEVYDLLFPDQAQAKAATVQVDAGYVHSELQKIGVTLKLLHEERVSSS